MNRNQIKSELSLYGLVLTGGKSSRMNQDKSLLEYHGKPQVQYCYDFLSGFCDKTFISNRADQSDLVGHKGLSQIHDAPHYSGIGPLAGILSAMEKFPNRAWLILACDLPYVSAATIKYLITHRNPNRLATAYKSSQNELPEPLCAIYEPHFYSKIFEFLKKGIDCPRKIMINSEVQLLNLPEPQALDNINNLEEFQSVLKSLNFKTKHG